MAVPGAEQQLLDRIIAAVRSDPAGLHIHRDASGTQLRVAIDNPDNPFDPVHDVELRIMHTGPDIAVHKVAVTAVDLIVQGTDDEVAHKLTAAELDPLDRLALEDVVRAALLIG